MLKFYAYIFYRFKNYYEMWQAIMVFNLIFIINIFSLFALYASVMDYSSQDFWFFYYTNDYFYNRFVLGVAKVLPIFITTFLLSIIFKKKLNNYYYEFKNESKVIQKRRAFGMWTYIVFTGLFFIFSLVSSLFI